MISKQIRSSFLIVMFIMISSCGNYQADLFKKNVLAYEVATDDLENQYVTILIHVGKDDPFNGPSIEKRGGYVVLKGEYLYNLVYSNEFNSVSFSNFLFSKLVRRNEVLLSQERFEKIKPYLISEEDAAKYLAMSTKGLLKKYTFSSEHLFTPSKKEDTPGYESRCILFNFLNNGFNVALQHESGFIVCKRAK